MTMKKGLYHMLPDLAEDFYQEFLGGERGEEIFTEFIHLQELHDRIQEKLGQGSIPEDGVSDATRFVNRMAEIITIVAPDAAKFNELKAFW